MPRGRQYYDPIVQAPSKVESAASRRIELYPEQDVRDNVASLRWVGRLVDERGVILEKAQGSFDHDDALRQAQELWPDLPVFELREESEDSTHEGMGPSPRLWQGSSPGDADGASRQSPPLGPFPENVGASPGPGDEHLPPADVVLNALVAPAAGTYVRLDDIVVVLEDYAVQFDEQSNPSGALALREAAAALREAS